MNTLNKMWRDLQPFLFVTVGALLNFSKISGELIGYSVLIIVCAMTLKVIVSFFMTFIVSPIFIYITISVS